MTDAPVVEVDEELVAVPSEGLDDWFVIERAAHDGSSWFVDVNGIKIPPAALHMHSVLGFQCSSRICDADVEGSRAEMQALANAILKGTSVSFKRAAVAYGGANGAFYFWSPRNSRTVARVPKERAVHLANQILVVTAPKESK